MIERRRMMEGKEGGIIPSGYRQVKDIVFNGNQYFITDIYLSYGDNSNLVELETVLSLSSSETRFIFSNQASSISNFTLVYYGGLVMRFGGNGGGQVYTLPANQQNVFYKVSFANSSVYLGDQLIHTFSSTLYNSSSSLIIGTASVGETRRFKGKIQNFDIKDINGDRHSLIPVVRVTDNIAGFWDTFTRTFYVSLLDPFDWEELD